MVDEIIPIKCPACGGDHCIVGDTSPFKNWFIPKVEWVWWGFGYKTNTYVCFSCGHVFQFVRDESLDQIRDKYSGEE